MLWCVLNKKSATPVCSGTCETEGEGGNLHAGGVNIVTTSTGGNANPILKQTGAECQREAALTALRVSKPLLCIFLMASHCVQEAPSRLPEAPTPSHTQALSLHTCLATLGFEFRTSQIGELHP